MRKPSRIAAAAAVAVAVAIGGPATGASADGEGATSAVTATITTGGIGSRSITVAAPVTMTSALNSATLTGSLATTVAEVARSGTNPWSVTAAIGTLTNATSDTLANTNMTISNRAVTPAAGGGTSTATSGSEVASAARTLFTNTGQLPATVYTGTYASTSDWTLAVPNGSKVGAYTGTITLTLVQ